MPGLDLGSLGPACQSSQPSPHRGPWVAHPLPQNSSRTGVSGGPAAAPAVGPARQLVPRACRARSRPPGRETAGHRPHQQPPPGRPWLAARLILCSWQGPRRLQGSVGGCHSVPSPMGTEPYTSKSARPAHSLHFRKSALYARPPPPCPPRGSRRKATRTPLGTKALPPAAHSPSPPRSYFCRSSPAGWLGVRAPFFPHFLFYLCFFHTWKWGSPGGQGSAPQPRVSPREGFGLSLSAVLVRLPSYHGHTVK